MATSHADLLKNILAFDFDDGDVALSFARRLARENGWSLTYANRAIVEYKRFAFLACTAGHRGTPSKHVDQVWHLHLTYTRSYWDRFCGQVLGRPLHHEPTRGGDAEAAKFESQYDKTLASYAAAFGEPAPSDIWPASRSRPPGGPGVARVLRGIGWIVQKPSRLAALLGFAAGSTITWVSIQGSSDAWTTTPANAGDIMEAAWIFIIVLLILSIIVRLILKALGYKENDRRSGGDADCGD